MLSVFPLILNTAGKLYVQTGRGILLPVEVSRISKHIALKINIQCKNYIASHCKASTLGKGTY